MPPLTFTVVPMGARWAISHGDQPVATFDTREEAERSALALAVRHPGGRTARVDIAGRDAPASTVIVF